MAADLRRPADFAFRPLRTPEEFRHAEALQREALGRGTAVVVPAGLLKEARDHGGLVLGAFADIYLAGCVVASLGWDGSTLYQRVHVQVVRPEYRGHRVGVRLASFLRDEVMRLGLAEVRWAFDPLQRAGAALSVRRLGARPTGYLPNYYGRLAEGDGAPDESDRLAVRWPLADPEVERRLGGALPTPDDDRARLGAALALVETEVAESGLRVPTAVAEPTGPGAHLEIPFDIASVLDHEPSSMRRWRHAVRDAFRGAFDLGYVVDDLVTVPVEHERRCFYLLRPPAPGGPADPG